MMITGRMRLLLCGLMTLKGFVCLYVCGWSPKMSLRLQKEAEVLRPRILLINTTSNIELSKNCKKTKSSQNCDAICQLYSWVRVREIFWNKLNVRNMPLFFPFCFSSLIPAKSATVWSVLNLENKCFWLKLANTKGSFRIMGWHQWHPIPLYQPSSKLLPVWFLKTTDPQFPYPISKE